jgi:hypothetical protein
LCGNRKKRGNTPLSMKLETVFIVFPLKENKKSANLVSPVICNIKLNNMRRFILLPNEKSKKKNPVVFFEFKPKCKEKNTTGMSCR